MRLTSLAFLVANLFFSCSKDPEKLWSKVRYDWIETQIYLEDQDTVITVKPSSNGITYHIEYNSYANYRYGQIFHGDTLLVEGIIDDHYPATGNETSCLFEGYCFQWQDNFVLCERKFQGDTMVIYQFPYLDGAFDNCHSSSLFRRKFTFY